MLWPLLSVMAGFSCVMIVGSRLSLLVRLIRLGWCSILGWESGNYWTLGRCLLLGSKKTVGLRIWKGGVRGSNATRNLIILAIRWRMDTLRYRKNRLNWIWVFMADRSKRQKTNMIFQSIARRNRKILIKTLRRINLVYSSKVRDRSETETKIKGGSWGMLA